MITSTTNIYSIRYRVLVNIWVFTFSDLLRLDESDNYSSWFTPSIEINANIGGDGIDIYVN